MARIDRYPATRETLLDCGHTANVGESVVVTKTYACERHAEKPIHATLTSINEALVNGIKLLKHLEWDLRHAK